MTAPVFADMPAVMRHALDLAARGLGTVEPNPAVGAVVVDDQLRILGEGFHERYGGPHAEVHALRAAGASARNATLVVTLEPCCHVGKTPPCTEAVIRAGIKRVIIGTVDPAPHVCGGGVEQLREAGIQVDVGLLEHEVRHLNAPFIKLMTTGTPWVLGKWAMTLDGKIASRTGASRWISCEASRARVHRLRGTMDGILVGRTTVRHDDPLLTARPPGPRIPTRIVLDSQGSLPDDSRLLKSLDSAPVLVVLGPHAHDRQRRRLKAAGAEVLEVPCIDSDATHPHRLDLARLLEELGRRGMTNLLVEGGGGVLGSFFDASLIDEVHVFIAPKLVGGSAAVTPLSGYGLDCIPQQGQLSGMVVETSGEDIYVHGRWQPRPRNEPHPSTPAIPKV